MGRLLTQFVSELSRPVVFIDIESTGLDYRQERIVELAFVKYTPERDIIRKTMLLDPEKEMDPIAEKIHGIKSETLKGKPKFADVASGLLKEFQDCDYGGANVGFDLMFLKEEFNRVGMQFDFDQSGRVDVLGIWKNKEPRNLKEAIKKFTKDADDQIHRAESDINKTVAVFEGQIEAFKLPTDVISLSKMSSRKEDLLLQHLVGKVDALSKEVSAIKVRETQFRVDVALTHSKNELDFFDALKKYKIDLQKSDKDGLLVSLDGTTVHIPVSMLQTAKFSFSHSKDQNIAQSKPHQGPSMGM